MPSTELTLKQQIEDGLKGMNDILAKEKEIDALLAKGQGVADVKQEVANLSVRNAELIESVQALKLELETEKATVQEVLKEREADDQRIQEIHTAVKDIRMGQGGPLGSKRTAGDMVAQAVKEANYNSETRRSKPSGVVINLSDDAQLHRTKDIDNTAGSGADLIIPQYLPTIIAPGVRQLRMRNLLPAAPTGSPTIIFLSEDSATDGAQGQEAQGDIKGESDIVFTQANETVETLATYLKVTTQMLDDVVQLGGYINTRGSFFVQQLEDEQILTGDGTAGELNGLIPQATAWDTTLPASMGVSSATDIDNLKTAIYQVFASNFMADGIVLHPFNWTSIELLKLTDNAYLFAQPQGMVTPALWGLPVVSTFSITNGTFLVGAFQMGAQLWDKQGLTITVATENEDDFIRNLAAIRFEKRMALTVYRTLAFVTGSLSVGS